MSVGSANLASAGGKIAVPILVRATMRAAVVVVTLRIMLLLILLVVFQGIIDDVRNDGGNIIVVGN